MQTQVVGGGIIQAGVGAGIDPKFLAARIALRPSDYANFGDVRGYYRVAISGGALTPPNANAVLLSLRWGDPRLFFVLLSVTVSLSVITAITAQRTDPISLTIQRKYTSNETTAITTLNLSGSSGQNNKMRSNMSTSLVTQLGTFGLSAGISGGTRTADARPIGTVGITGLGALGSVGVPETPLYEWDTLGQHPVVLSKDEGLTSSWGATALATGTVNINYVLNWAEVTVF